MSGFSRTRRTATPYRDTFVNIRTLKASIPASVVARARRSECDEPALAGVSGLLRMQPVVDPGDVCLCSIG